MKQVIARFLGVRDNTVQVAPHTSLNMMMPIWVGGRRWTQSRKRYKALINKKRNELATATQEKRKNQWKQQHPAIATALQGVEWKRVYQMEGSRRTKRRTLGN